MQAQKKKRLAILAGGGHLPYVAAKEALKKDYEIIIYVIIQEQDNEDLPDSYQPEYEKYIKRVHLGQFGKLLRQIKKDKITDFIMIGKVRKKYLFQGIKFDLKTLWLLATMKDHNDDTFFHAIKKELDKLKIKVIYQTELLAPLYCSAGILTKKKPNKKQWRDINFGLYYARKIGGLDIGQTVIVKKKTVIAVEAIEGTDDCIRRGGKLAGKGAIVCKVEKENQDHRFDIPSVGVSTLTAMYDSACTILAFESDKTFVLQREDLIDFANKNGIIVISAKVPKTL